MSQLVRVQNFFVSMDGFGAGEGQSLEAPFGQADRRGGSVARLPIDLASWAFATASWPNRAEPGGSRGLDDYLVRDFTRNIGAEIMGRNKFGPQRGPWENLDWTGWWGDVPPFHTPVFVLTHHPRPKLEMKGGNSFTFVTDGIESALRQARKAAGSQDISLAGGARACQEYLRAGLVDEMEIHLVPILLGQGERLFDGVSDLNGLRPVRTIATREVTHLKFARPAG